MAPTTFRRIQIAGPPQRNQTPDTLSSPQESESAIFDSPILAPPRSQIPRPSNESRKGSFSDSEGHSVARPQVRSARSSSRSGDDARPSGLPRLATNLPTLQRPSVGTVASPRPVTPQNPQCQQPAYNATTVSQQGGRTRNVLRRKANFTKENTNDSAQFTTIKPQASSSTVHSNPPDSSKGRTNDIAKEETAVDAPLPDSSSATSRLPRVRTPRSSEDSRPIAKEFASLRTVNNTSTNTNNLPPPPLPPTPIFSATGSPSTRCSESPSIWDSRDSTPTSLSSHSPGIVHSVKAPQRLRQPSPSHIRPPVAVPRSFTSPVARTAKHEPAIASTSTPTDLDASIQDKVNRPFPESPTKRKIFPRSDNPDSAGDETATEAELRLFAPPAQSHVKPTSRSATAPPRPSRQGTDSLELIESPVIHSNLTSLKTTGRSGREVSDRSMTKQRVMPVPSAATSVESIQSATSKSLSRSGPTTSQIPRKSKQVLTKSPKQQPSEAGSTRRLGLFSKKSKGDLGGNRSTQAGGVSTRKGPAAGTGHEGYGKYSHRGRRPSVGSSTSGTRARSASSTGRSVASSRGSQAEWELDDFLLERLEPVVISGGGSELVRTQSGQSASAVSVTSAGTSSSIAAGIPIGGGYSTDSLASPSNLAVPQHRQRSPAYPPPSPVKISPRPGQPSVKNAPTTAQQTKELETGFSALPPIESAPSGRDTKKSEKHGPFRWNFFQRKHKSTHTSDKESQPTVSSSRPDGQLHAAVAPVSSHRTVPHYALIEPDSDSLDEILHRIEDSPPSEDEVGVSQGSSAGKEAAQRHEASVLLPSPPPLWAEYVENAATAPRPASPKVYFHKEAEQNKDNDRDNNPQTSRARPSRLKPVGRIPRVVPRQGTDSRPSAQLDGRSDERPAPRGTTDNQTSAQTFEEQPLSSDAQPKPAFALNEGLQFASGAYASNEFLHFSPNQESYNSSSSSEGNSILAAVSAMGPFPHHWSTTEDDIWAEYDDLVDSVLRAENPPPTNPAVPSDPDRTKPFELATKASMTLQAELNTTRDEGVETSSRSPEIPTVALPPSSARSSQSSVRLRRSAIAPALHTSISPQASSSDLVVKSREQIKASNNAASEEAAPAAAAAASEDDNPSAEDVDAARRRKLLEQAERDRDGTMAQINLRSASLMTSRWLSFGRVLFSPAHSRIKAAVDTERILVIDGLGNDDWSYYCALTYPGATVYSLTGTPTTTPSHPNAWSPPENHHLIYYADPEAPFPFPKNFFSVCIMRFPAACSERGQQNMISECKRVLRAGGYLEMSILDLDLVNVGSRTRKAIRQLKERIFLADPAINLKPASDHIQKLLGTCGFDNLNRCMVGLPVAGMIGGSTSSSSSSSSSSDPSADHSNNTRAKTQQSRRHQKSTKTPPPPSAASSCNDNDNDDDDAKHSLGELLSDPSPTASNDESIAKMVTRVGRWWYTRCYEVPVLETLDHSVWADHRLLRECQKRGTSFRLLIAYAQKPSEKRRTMSV